MTKMIMLKNSDEQTFDIEETASTGSKTIKHMIEDDCANLAIPLPNITSKILFKVTEYLKKHDNSVTSEISDEDKNVEKEALEAFDTEFVKVDHNTLFDLTLAANYLDIKGLLDLTCKTIADMIKGKTPEEIRQTFKEEAVRKEKAWAFE